MAWLSHPASLKAKHLESGTEFSIARSRHMKSVDDIEITPIDGKPLPADQIAQIKVELWEHWEHIWRRDKLNGLIRNHLRGDTWRAAAAISDVSGTRVSNRTVQSWIIDISKRSSRTCPAWSVKALEDYLADPKNKPSLEYLNKAETTPFDLDATISDMMDNKSVELASNQIAWQQRQREEWRATSITDLPNKIYEHFHRQELEIEALSKDLAIFSAALKNSENYEDFRTTVNNKVRAQKLLDFEIKRTRQDIEKSAEEFADPEGIAR